MYSFYKILHKNVPVYVGITSQTLQQRFAQHKRDANSSVYKNYQGKSLVIKPINISINEPMNLQKALWYEEVLTYLYGSKYDLCNTNAGNASYKFDDNEFYRHIQFFCHAILEGTITTDEECLAEIISNIQDKCGIHYSNDEIRDKLFYDKDNLLNEVYDACIEKMCECDDYD